MSFIIQQIITGLSIGGIYALLAVGYALIYSVFDFSNFAFGCVMMTSAFACYFCTTVWGIELFTSILISTAAGIILSLLIEFGAYRPIRRKGGDRLFLMITGMGVDLAVTNFATIMLGANARAITIRDFNMDAFQLGSVYLSKLDMFAMIIALVSLVVLYIFINKTRVGLGIRASAYSTSIAGIMGVNVNSISIVVFLISGITAGLGGIFCGMKYCVMPTIGTTPALKAFIASAIGGLGSLPGAVVGGLILGVLETFVSGFISSCYRDLFAYGLLILVLFFLPNGLMAKSKEDKL